MNVPSILCDQFFHIILFQKLVAIFEFLFCRFILLLKFHHIIFLFVAGIRYSKNYQNKIMQRTESCILTTGKNLVFNDKGKQQQQHCISKEKKVCDTLPNFKIHLLTSCLIISPVKHSHFIFD